MKNDDAGGSNQRLLEGEKQKTCCTTRFQCICLLAVNKFRQYPDNLRERE